MSKSESNPPTTSLVDALFSANPQPMWIYDEDTLGLLEVNEAACSAYGYTREEFEALRITDIVSSDRVDGFLKLIRENSEELRRTLSSHRKRNGKNFPVEITAIHLNYNGIPARLVQVTDVAHHLLVEKQLKRAHQDMELRVRERTSEIAKTNQDLLREIEHRKEVERILVEREEFFRLISETMTDMIAVIDRDGNRLYNSSSYKSVIGDPENLHGTNSFEEIHPEDRDRVRQIFEDTVSSGVGQRTEYRFLLPGGQVRHVESLGSVIKDGKGGVSKVVVVSRDITERKETEREVTRLATAIRAVGEAIMIIDPEDRIQFVNPAFEKLTGYAAIEVVGRSPRILSSGEHDDDFFSRISDSLRAGQNWSGTVVDRRKDGSLYTAAETTAPIRGHENTIIGFVTVKRDISEQIKQQAEIEALNEVLEKRVEARTSELAAANEELEAFSYSVSHDLRPPLRAVAGFTKILQDDHSTKLNDDGKRFLALVRKNTHQMGDLIDDLLAFSRLSRQEISALEVDIEAITQSAWDLLKQSWSGRTIEFKIHDLPRVKADPVLLKQVLVNLLSNAIKFTRDEEKAMIEVGLQESRNNEWVTFYVRDNGVGFNEKYARNLLGVFQRLHRAEEYEGTGVGLAIVQRIIHRHGGSVSATSKPNEGATFLFSLRRFVE